MVGSETAHRFDLTGKCALVTGGSGALGSGMAEALGESGAAVVIVGRNEQSLAEVTDQLRGWGVDALAVRGDAAVEEDVERAVEQAASHFGSVDILLNAAGTHGRTPSLDLESHEWDRIQQVNLRGAYLFSKAAASVMSTNGGGKIIHIASVASMWGLPGRLAYAASKGGLVMLVRSLAVEWAPYNIQVNAIAPGFFRTRINEALFQDDDWRKSLEARIPAARAGQVEDLAGAAVFLSSSASDYVTGQVLYVDGGFTAGERM